MLKVRVMAESGVGFIIDIARFAIDAGDENVAVITAFLALKGLLRLLSTLPMAAYLTTFDSVS